MDKLVVNLFIIQLHSEEYKCRVEYKYPAIWDSWLFYTKKKVFYHLAGRAILFNLLPSHQNTAQLVKILSRTTYEDV